ncbi:MAG: hypothetical protein EOP49_16180 [Sphingobacteriales bacterium]|nr:MAG: hypothetical protein EOP49_16180 [Sphingobacteriales bacterium]
MKYCFAAIAALIAFSACNNKPGGKSNDGPVDGCYMFINEKDTVCLKLEGTGKNVTGKLLYQYFAKDKNTGSLKGEMTGDTLWAKYTFMSEGQTSDRELVFLRKGEDFVEGFGKLNDSTGEPDFSDRSALHFESKMVLKKVDCASMKAF